MASRLTCDVKELLQGVFGVSGILLSKRAKTITDLLSDPLLWLYVKPGIKDNAELATRSAELQALVIDGSQSIKHEELLQKRLCVLKTALLQRTQALPDIKNLASIGRARGVSELFGSDIMGCPDTRLRCEMTVEAASGDSDGACFTAETIACPSDVKRMRGVVTDLYSEENSAPTCTGYIVSLSSTEMSCPIPVYRFTASSLLPAVSFSLHIGDIVSFTVTDPDTDSTSIVPASLRVEEYPWDTVTELCVTLFLDQVASLLQQSEANVLHCVPAYWKGALNEERFYRQSNIYRKLLAIYNAADSSHKKDIFCNSGFVTKILSLLASDERKQQPISNSDSAMTSYKQDITTALSLVADMIQLPSASMLWIDKCLNCLGDLVDFVSCEDISKIAVTVISRQLSVQNGTPGPAVLDLECDATDDDGNGVDLRDPLLLLELRYGKCVLVNEQYRSLLGDVKFTDDDEAVARRMEVAKAGAGMQSLHSSPLIMWQFTPPPPPPVGQCGGRQKYLTLQGIISDVIATESDVQTNTYVGLILHTPLKSSSKHQREVQAYSLDHNTPFQQPHGLHIGDIVTFTADGASKRVEVIKEVVRYFPGCLGSAVARDYMNSLCQLQPAHDLINTVSQLSALFKAILDQSSLYSDSVDICRVILKVCCQCIQQCVLEDSVRMLSRMFKDRLFVWKIPHVLDSMPGIDTVSLLQSATELLSWVLRHARQPVMSNVSVESLKCLMHLLTKHELRKEVVMLTRSLVISSFLPVEAPTATSWKDTPILLTKEEFAEGISNISTKKIPQVQKTGGYHSLDQYGETYFKLLRYDCYGELLQSIGRLQHERGDQCQDTYYRLSLVGIGRDTFTGRIVYSFDFETKAQVDGTGYDDQHQNLKEGNLVCLSPGGRFTEPQAIWAVINKAECRRSVKSDVELKEVK